MLAPDSIVAMDRAYNDYDLFGRWCDEGVWFVTCSHQRTVTKELGYNSLAMAVEATRLAAE